MKKALLYYGLIILFAILFVLGFFITPWLTIASFIPLIVGLILLIRWRVMKK